MIQLGNKVRDTISGFEGIAVGRAEFMYGCARVQIEPQTLKDGKPIDTCWFDEQRVETVVAQPPQVSREAAATSGGPQSDPCRSSASP